MAAAGQEVGGVEVEGAMSEKRKNELEKGSEGKEGREEQRKEGWKERGESRVEGGRRMIVSGIVITEQSSMDATSGKGPRKG